MDILSILQYSLIVVNAVLFIFLLILLIGRPAYRLLTTALLCLMLLVNIGLCLGYIRIEQQAQVLSALDNQDDSELLKTQTLMRELVESQARFLLTDVTQASNDESFTDQLVRVKQRDELLAQLKSLGSRGELVKKIQQDVDESVLSFLFEDFSRSLVDAIGGKKYAELLKSKPREQWTDETFIEFVAAEKDIQAMITEELHLKMRRWQLFYDDKVLFEEGL